MPGYKVTYRKKARDVEEHIAVESEASSADAVRTLGEVLKVIGSAAAESLPPRPEAAPQE